MPKRLEPGQPLSSTTPRLVVPQLSVPVYRTGDHEAPSVAADHRSPPADRYFWAWLDDLKAVRYL
jgi:hypothetical protein